MNLPTECGPVSRRVLESLRTEPGRMRGLPALGTEPVLEDRDVQLALWILYELSFRGFDEVPADREWDPDLIAVRCVLERRLEHELRDAVAGRVGEARAHSDDVATAVLWLAETDEGAPLAAHLHRSASAEEFAAYLKERSLQQLKESDPQSFLLPRLTGAAKVALAELQYDEYGAGRSERLHQTLYAHAMEGAGLDATYGAYVDEIGVASLAAANLPAMLGLQRRLRGAAAGYFAAFEATSSVPSRKVAQGAERLGFPPAVAAYFHEHVEADAVHEQVAARDLCGSLEPALHDDVLFGAAACLHVEDAVGADLLARWTQLEAAS